MAAAQPSTAWGVFASAQPFRQGLHESANIDGDNIRRKRAKVALACQRCKKRKQKCDGAYPCSKCEALDLHCEYVVPSKPMPFGKNHYIESLERRVAELETLLATHGIDELSSDHWKHGATMPDAGTDARLEASVDEARASPQSDSMSDDVLEWQDGVDPVVSVLRSLSLDVNGSGYIGASSHVALGRLFSFLGSRSPSWETGGMQRSLPSNTIQSSRIETAELAIELTDVPSHIAERLFAGYLRHIATRFPVIHSVWARSLHIGRHALTDTFEKSTLHLVYAAAGRFLETAGESGNFEARRHYEMASQSLGAILDYNDIRTSQTLMLMAVYCLRDPVGLGAWTYSRTALLIAIDRAFHRQARGMSELTLPNELRKRFFWACYSFDRQISIPMGRPFGISDRDIDLEMPLDIDEDSTEEQVASYDLSTAPMSRSTTLTSFIRIVELRKIESEIQQTIYRVDRTAPVENEVIDLFLGRLAEWKDKIPADTKRFKDVEGLPFDGYDFYLVFYYKCQRLLLYPSIIRRDVELRFLKECARACAGVCGTYKRLHQTIAVGYSSMAVQTVFMAGLTLVYCIWLRPDDIFDMATSNGIHDCSVVLFVIAERVSAVKKYRNAFEAIRQRVIDHLAESPRTALRETVPGLTAQIAPSELEAERVTFDDGSYEQLSQIMADMAGEEWMAAANGSSYTQSGETAGVDFDAMFSLSDL